MLEVSALHEDPTFVLAPGHDPAQLDAFAALAGAAPGRSAGGGRGYAPGTPGEHAAMPAIRADPFCVPELDEFLARHETWIAPEALEPAAGGPRGARAGGGPGRAVGRDRGAAGR